MLTLETSVATFAALNSMFFHSVNAYDYIDKATGDQDIHVDLCSFKGDYCPYREYHLSNVVDPAQAFMDGTTSPLRVSGREQGHSIQDWTRDSRAIRSWGAYGTAADR
ncbi:uncharacterized protein K441DRAFT_666852 [Cenococcum geophilum 1.58]|uniref:uncharacterized protein n=1 Tax=Cenococcum geophilum 1.58 TaxID=794803 RepID=UPI00358E64B6|nr:hypothetical protein K441DRAFT_666852 [Cenococcum geophilum 1.58]